MQYKNLLSPLCVLAVFPLAAANYSTMNHAAVELTHVAPTKAESTWLREKQVSPRYPVKLAAKGIFGCGVFKVQVNEDGETESVSLVRSLPEKVIAKPAKKVIKRWDWTLAEGKTPVAEEKILRLDFCMGGDSQEAAQQRCKQQAAMTCE